MRILVACVAGLALVGTAAAQSPPNGDAELHFNQGVALLQEKNYVAALAEFEESYHLSPVPGVLYNKALALKGLFRYVEAIDAIKLFLSTAKNLTPDQIAEANQLISEMQDLLADVLVDVVPDGATISVDGRVAGTSPLTKPVPLAAGAHTIEVTKDKYKPERHDIIVTAKVAQLAKFALVLIPTTGKVHITTTAPHATISIDGKPQGPPPLDLDLEAGGHSLEVSAPGYETRRDELVVAVEQTRQVAVTLDKVRAPPRGKPFYTSWKFWLPVGVIVVGGSIGLAAGLSRPSPIDGTLSPGVGSVH